MKIANFTLSVYFLFAGYTGYGQQNNESLDENTISTMLQGKWADVTDSTAVFFFREDTLMDFSIENGLKYYTIDVSDTKCSKKESDKSNTGFYLREKSIEDAAELCAAIQIISKSRLRLAYSKKDIIDLKKKILNK
jgi:hypothetical protein